MIWSPRQRTTFCTLNLKAEASKAAKSCWVQRTINIQPLYALSLLIQARVSSVCQRLFSHGGVSPSATFSHKSSKHKQLLAASQSEGNVESSSVLHTREVQTQEEFKRAPTHCRVNTRERESEKKVLVRRVTSLTAAETVTGVGEAFFTSLFFFFAPSLKGCCVVNNTVAFIHTGGPLCVQWMGCIMRGGINIRRGRIGSAVFFLWLSQPVFTSLMMSHMALHAQVVDSLNTCRESLLFRKKWLQL